jgi:epoxyqueuosine reductase
LTPQLGHRYNVEGMPEKEPKDSLKNYAVEMGINLFGVADISEERKRFNLDDRLKADFNRAISLGKRLIVSVLEDIEDHPTPLYFHHYRQLNFFLDRAAFLLSSRIQDSGFKAMPIPASQIIDWEKQRAHLSHKKIGQLAGLGWIGRNNLLVNPDFGAQFRLVTVLTDMPLAPDRPLDMGCSDCRRCLACCPADAIKERQEDFDHQACFEKLKEFRRLRIVSQFICGICIKACQPTSGEKG